MDDVTDKRSINVNTGITLSAGALILTGILWINNSVNAGNAKIDAVKSEAIRSNERIEGEMKIVRLEMKQLSMELQQKLDAAGNDRWTFTDMRRWVREFREKNAAVVVPDPEHK